MRNPYAKATHALISVHSLTFFLKPSGVKLSITCFVPRENGDKTDKIFMY